MTDVVILDSGPVGMLSNPNPSPDVVKIRKWFDDLLRNSRRVVIPEIVDYEVRRELIRANRLGSLQRLDSLIGRAEFSCLTSTAIRDAAFIWAQIRNAGKPTASPLELDIDVILVAQAIELNVPVIVATGNAAHIRHFLPADDWTAIIP